MLILLTLTAADFIVSYVETMILPAVPQIQKDFVSSATTASWITAIVLLVGAACSPLLGKLGDVHGKKKMLLLSFAVYTAGAGLAGLSPSIYFLLFARALQGFGFAVMPLSLAMVTDAFPREKLASAQGTIAGVAAISATAGLVLGSYVVQSLGWRESFYTAFIVSLIFFSLASKFLKEGPHRSMTHVDYAGSVTLIAGIALVLLYLSEGATTGWLSLGNLALLTLGLVLCTSFFFLERRRTSPLIQLDLLRIRNVLVANLATIISGLGNFLLFYAFVYYAELPRPEGLGISELSTGIALAPATLAMLVVGPLSGRAVAKVGPRPVMLVGSLTMIAGFALLILERASTIAVSIDAMVALPGIVALLVSIVNMISVSLPGDAVAVGQGINGTLKSIGQAAGPVLATALMSTYTTQAGLPSPIAFNAIFGIGIVLIGIVACISLATRNYVVGESTVPRE